MAELSPRQVALPPASGYPPVYDNVGLDVAVWLPASLMCLVVLVKISCKFANLQRLQPDDAFLIAASLAAIGQAIAVLEQISSGLGDSLSALSTADFEALQQADYASQILYVTADGLAKAALALAIDHLSPSVSHKINARTLLAVSFLWTLAAIIATAAQCSGAASPWMTYSPMCFDQTAYWDVISAFDIVLDALLVGLVVMSVWKLSIATSTKAQIVAAYSTKLISVPLVTLRVVFYRNAHSSLNRTAADGNVAVATQLALTLGIIATCVPYLKALACNMEHGLLTNDMRIQPPRRQNLRPAPDYVKTPYEEKHPALESPHSRRASLAEEAIQDRKPSVPEASQQKPRPRPPPVRTRLAPGRFRHISIQASAAKSPGINSPITPKMMIQKLTSFWTEEEQTAPQIPPITAHSEFYFPR